MYVYVYVYTYTYCLHLHIGGFKILDLINAILPAFNIWSILMGTVKLHLFYLRCSVK